MKNYLLFLSLAASFVVAQPSNPVGAVPINGQFLPDPTHCDGPSLPSIQLQHEIGDGTAANPFPINERILVNVTPLPVPFPPTCVADDLLVNDWLIRIVNISGVPYQDLYFVADDVAAVVGNYDGRMLDLSNPNFPPAQAYRIDGTVTPGANNPLLQEVGGTVNEIFEPGESWLFYLINFQGGVPSFGSIGAFGAGSIPNTASTASILANVVPEPTGITLGLFSGLMFLWRRRNLIAKS